jgi:hypothetical protein
VMFSSSSKDVELTEYVPLNETDKATHGSYRVNRCGGRR